MQRRPAARVSALQMTVASCAPAPDMKLVRSPEAAFSADKSGCAPRRETAMVHRPDPNTEKSEMRVMWIGSLAIVLLLLGAMGINMLMTHNTSIGMVETTGQSGASPK
jgi:hypothetical protein